MKRSEALASLSRDHHQALVAAQRLRRSDAASAADARAAFLAHWDGHGARHFRLEEEVLLPAFAAHGDAHHPLVARVLCDHVEIRRRAAEVRAGTAGPEALQALGRRMAEHVRLEERELFGLLEAEMPAEALSAVAAELERAEQSG